jgi:hypothetical protein
METPRTIPAFLLQFASWMIREKPFLPRPQIGNRRHDILRATMNHGGGLGDHGGGQACVLFLVHMREEKGANEEEGSRR